MKKEFRVKKSEDIEQIIKEKNITAGKDFVIYKKENHEQNHFKYAVSVPKKFGIAVLRNQIKRRVRMIIREKEIVDDYDFFIVIKVNASKLSFDEIKSELDYLLNKAQLEVKHE